MTIAVGDKLPAATIYKLGSEGPEAVETADFFAGRKVVVFAVPGAFTPTCNAKHLPGYVQHAAAIKAKGVDEIACVAVNDPFVMDAWSKAGSVGDAVTMLSDGNGAFSTALGLTFDGSGFGLATRSRRYAMIVDDGVVKHLAIDPAPPVLEESAAEKTLAAL